jgi:hypothetical protein
MLTPLGWSFAAGYKLFSGREGDPKSLTIDHFADVTGDGRVVNNPRQPYSLLFAATKEAKALLAKITPTDDFRHLLEGKGNNMVLYRVYARKHFDSVPTLVGQIVTRTHFVASRFGDENLFFRHHDLHEPRSRENL